MANANNKNTIRPGRTAYFKDSKRSEPNPKSRIARGDGVFQKKSSKSWKVVEKTEQKDMRRKMSSLTPSDGKLSVDQNIKIAASRYIPGQRRLILSPRLQRKDYDELNNDEDDAVLKRPATVALPHIPGQRFLESPDHGRDWIRRSLPDITANKERLKGNKLIDRTDSSVEIKDLRTYPLDKFEREYIEKNSKNNHLDPVSYTYLTWLEENPQTIIKLRNHGLGAKSLTIVKNCLENNNIVKELDLAGNDLNDIGIEDLALWLRGNMYITSLDISSNIFSSKGIIAIGNLLEANKTLTSLSLSRNHLTDTDLELLCSGLEDTDNRLNTLDLSFNSFTPQAGFTLGRLLAIDNTLKELDVQGNSMGPVGCWQIFNGLRNGSLERLNIAANEISEDGIVYIAEINDFGKKLSHLDLSDNFITELGVKYLMPMLDCNTTLTTLKLDDNLIGRNGLIYLLQCLVEQRNTTLSQLYVKGTFADETVKCLCTKIRTQNSKFILVGALGIYGSHGVDTLRTLQIYLRNNNIINTKRLEHFESVDCNNN